MTIKQYLKKEMSRCKRCTEQAVKDKCYSAAAKWAARRAALESINYGIRVGDIK